MSKIVSMDTALDLIQDNAVIASSGFVMAGTAESILKALGERYEKTGHPKNLTGVFCASQGDGAGLGYDHLAKDGLLGKVIGGHFGLTPALGKYMADNKCMAYNYPLGVMAALFRNAIQQRSGEMTKVGLKTFVDPRLEGGRINAVTTEDLVQVVKFQGEEWLWYPTPKFDIAILRGTAADEDGNITLEHEPVRLDLLSIAMAVKACGGKVIFQVKHTIRSGSLTADQVEIPGTFVDAVVISPNPMDEHRQVKTCFYDPSMSGHINVPVDSIPPLPLDVRKVMARRAAMELSPNAVVNLGIGVPEGVAVVAAEEGFGDQLTLTTESGILGGVPCGGGAFGAGQNAQGVLDMRTMFDFYDGGGLDMTVLGLAEVNAKGDINVGRFGPKNPGCGGFINISQNTHKAVFCGSFTAGGLEVEIGGGALHILKEGRNRKFVSQVQQVTYSGEYGSSIGQDVTYVTERAVFKLTREGLMLTEVAPGINLQKDVLDQMGFEPILSKNLGLMDPRIFTDAKMGLTI
ncbi:acyl CoA:acetate/3-ketoacid CoA transferase [Lawsonibacter celer]|uniref:acyl CoA:acetate/3-ketoacid CoA transferase n=1 Tax=Lawsonibacter celer TaxID=2986526 RepID=UPI0016442BA6|nr:CoA-transferase [Lawsonibacter celer]